MEYKKKLAALNRKKKLIDSYTYNNELYKIQLHSPTVNKKIEKLKKLYPGLADECYELEREFMATKRVKTIEKPKKKILRNEYKKSIPSKTSLHKQLLGIHRQKQLIVPDGYNINILKENIKLNQDQKDDLKINYGVPFLSQSFIYPAILNGVNIYYETGYKSILIYVDKDELLNVFTTPPNKIYINDIFILLKYQYKYEINKEYEGKNIY